MVGFVFGFIRMIVEFVYGIGSCLVVSGCSDIICGVYYLYFVMIFFFVITLVVLGIFLLIKFIFDVYVSNW